MRKWIALLCLATAAATAAADPRLDQAMREGEVLWYTAMNAGDAEAVLRPFRARYPFLRINILRDAGEKLRDSILAEAADDRSNWDVVSVNLLDLDALNRRGLLAAYASPETKSGFPAGAVDPAGRWTGIYVRQYVIGYNTRLVRPAEAPKAWEDLLQARWAGRFALDEGDVEWYAAMLDYLGRRKGVAFMRALGRQKPQLRRGHQVLTQQLIAGKLPLALVYAGEIERGRRTGAPVEWVKTLEPTVVSPSRVGISVKAPNPASARLLVDYLLSKDGQRAIRSRGRVPVRTDVADSTDEGPRNAHYVDPRLAPRLGEYGKEFRAILLGTQ